MTSEKEVRTLVHSRPMAMTDIADPPGPDKVAVEVYGHHASYCRKGFRIWGFETIEGRDRFVRDFEAIVR